MQEMFWAFVIMEAAKNKFKAIFMEKLINHDSDLKRLVQSTVQYNIVTDICYLQCKLVNILEKAKI